MKISKRDLKLLFVLFGLLAFLGLYMLGYQKIVEKTDVVKSEISALRPEVQVLENHYSNLEKYQTGISECRSRVMSSMASYPADVKEEDFLSYLLVMEDAEKIILESVTFNPATVLSSFDASIQRGGQDEAATSTFYKHGAVITAQMNYTQAKNVMDYIYNSEYTTLLDNVTMTYNSETGGLTTNFSLVKYSLDWPLATYKPEPIPETEYGVENLFGTN